MANFIVLLFVILLWLCCYQLNDTASVFNKIQVSSNNGNKNTSNNYSNITDASTENITLSTLILQENCFDIECKIKKNVTSITSHTPLFGFIPRKCPLDPLPELFSIRRCANDQECWPRVCCFDENELTGFCRISIPIIWDQLPMPKIVSPLRTAMAYWQCTPPPPPNDDLFPKLCRSTFDCFPNLCCQEKDKKVCRPPKKSILTLVSSLAQRESWFG